MKLGLAFIAVSLLAPVAFAQEPPPPPPPPPDPTMPPSADVVATSGPGAILPNMLPTRVGGTFDVRMDYSHFGEGGFLFNEDLFLLGLNLHGQYIWPESYGVYVTMPYYYASADDESEHGLGNLELGGLYKVPQGATSEILLRGGIAVDTAGRADALLAPISQLSPRLYDAYSIGFETNWLKAEGSFRHAEGNLRLGLSAGVDVPFAGDDDGIELDAIGKVAVSVGVENPDGVGFGVGLVMLYALGVDDESDEEALFGLNASLGIPISPTMALYGAFGLPDLENNIDEFDLFSIGVGLRAAMN